MARVTEDQKQQIFDLCESGMPIGRVAQRVGLLPNTARYHAMKMGCWAPPMVRRQGVAMRNGHQVRPFTEAEDAELLQRRAAGEAVAAIARDLGRKPHSALQRLYILTAAAEAAD